MRWFFGWPVECSWHTNVFLVETRRDLLRHLVALEDAQISQEEPSACPMAVVMVTPWVIKKSTQRNSFLKALSTEDVQCSPWLLGLIFSLPELSWVFPGMGTVCPGWHHHAAPWQAAALATPLSWFLFLCSSQMTWNNLTCGLLLSPAGVLMDEPCFIPVVELGSAGGVVFVPWRHMALCLWLGCSENCWCWGCWPEAEVIFPPQHMPVVPFQEWVHSKWIPTILWTTCQCQCFGGMMFCEILLAQHLSVLEVTATT